MNTTVTRIDEVSKAYLPAERADYTAGLLFWGVAILSFLILFPDWFAEWPVVVPIIKTGFAVGSVLLFGLFLASKLYFLPRAERLRRKQLLANAFDVPLTSQTTELYYNNSFSPSHQRLAANVMENAFFGHQIAEDMLLWIRLKTGLYFLAWLAVVSFRHESMDVVVWGTQFVFSADVIAYWCSLELLRSRHESTYDQLYNHFFHEHHEDNAAKATAETLDAFAAYESTKAVTGVLLNSKTFEKLNPKLTEEWEVVQKKLSIDGENT